MSLPPTSGVAISGSLGLLVRRLHFYIGLFIAPFIFIAALTGTLYIATPQLEGWIYREALTTLPNGEAKPLSDQVAAARGYIGQDIRIYALRPASAPDQTTRVQFKTGAEGASLSRALFVDPYTLAIKGDYPVYGTSGILPLRTQLDLLHRQLLLGEFGRNYSELAASWLWVAVLGGLVLWATTRPRRKIKARKNAFAWARHWHITLGLVLAIGLLLLSVTGLTWSNWAGDHIGSLRKELNWLTPQVNDNLDSNHPREAADPHAEHHGADHGVHAHAAMMADHSHSTEETEMSMSMPMSMPMPMVNAANDDWDKVLAAGRAGGLQSHKVELRQPASADKAWTVTEIDRRWPTHVDAVSVNPRDFSLVDYVRFDTFPLVAKLTRWGVDAHMGILFGLANQLVLIALGMGLCVMIVLGYRLWWLRRPAMTKISPLDTLLGIWLSFSPSYKATVVIILVLLGYALPLMGASLIILLLIDLWRWRRRAIRQ